MTTYSKTEILEEVKNYLDDEYNQTNRILTKAPRSWWIDPKETKEKAVNRAMGVVMFAQRFHCDYEELEAKFEDFKWKIHYIEPTREVEHRGGVRVQ
jgi:hypothetical protein